jgi:hypothetical protein
MLKHVHSFFDIRLPSLMRRTGCYCCDTLLAMEHGLLHVDALDRHGRHFLHMCPEHMLGRACCEKEFATRMWALKPSPIVFWSFLRHAPRHINDYCRSVDVFVLKSEQLWVDLSLVDGEWSPAVKERKTWTQGLRRAWIVAATFHP